MNIPLRGLAFYRLAVLCWLFFVLVITSRPLYGYVDPGSGLFIVQIIGSTFAGVALILRRRIRLFFARFSRSPKKDGQLN